MTIEIALIMPIILIMFVLLIYLSGYLYNRQTIEKIACIGIEKGLMMEHDSSFAIKTELDQYVRQQLMERMIFQPDTKYSIEVNKMNISIEISFTQDLPIKGFIRFLSKDSVWHAKAKQKAVRLNPAVVMWMKG